MIEILIADDHPIVREGLKRIVEECPDMRVLGEAVDGDEAVAKSRKASADVLLLDISMPGPGFLETLQRVRALPAAPRVLVLSVHPEDQFAVRALRAGAAGYLTKEQSPEELADAIRRVQGGGKYVSRKLAEKL
ncbi:MAG: response regulator transcription factor, partial [Planctomycetota bacterium]